MESSQTSFVRIENFLQECDRALLLRLVTSHKHLFVPALTTSNELNFRQALVIYDLPQIFPLLKELIDTCVPFLTRALGMQDFLPSQIEMQLTAHLDGAYFKPHRDNASPKTRRRRISYAYYFHNFPKQFGGGELVIFRNSQEQTTESPQIGCDVLEAVDNSIVFFRSEQIHEVRPILSPSVNLIDARLTVNGWIHY